MIVYHAYRKDVPAFYIGKTIYTLEYRKRQHENESRYIRGGSHFHRALQKFGVDSFEWKVLENCSTIDELNLAERKWIKLVRECGHKLYNITDGGTGGDCGGSSYWKEHGLRDETKLKISESLKQYYKTNTNPRKGRTCVGHKHTEESKIKIAKTKVGHIVSSETREKLRIANTGNKLSSHVIEVLREKFSGIHNPSAKRIRCVTTNEVFDYAKLAAQKYDSDLSSIIKCCKGKLKSVKGKVYEYL